MAAEMILQKETMSSFEIAELTGKRHDAILRDIRGLLSQGVDAHNFVETYYVDKANRKSPCFNLTKKGCLILASGYDAKLREKIIDRWEELETKERTREPLSPSELILKLAQMNVENERKMKELEAKQGKLENELQEIKQRTTTDLHQSTIVAYVSRNHIKLDVTRYGAMGRKASALCKKRDIEVLKVNDVRWGKVNVFPDDILDEVFSKKGGEA